MRMANTRDRQGSLDNIWAFYDKFATSAIVFWFLVLDTAVAYGLTRFSKLPEATGIGDSPAI